MHACLCIIKGGTVYKIYKFLLQWLDYMFQVSGCLMTFNNFLPMTAVFFYFTTISLTVVMNQISSLLTLTSTKGHVK